MQSTAPPPASSAAPFALECPVGLALAALFAYAARFAGFSLLADDAFISFRYAENLAITGELVYNAGERVEGFSNALWTLLLAVVARLGGSVPTAAVAMGFVAGALTVLGVAYTASRQLGSSLVVSTSVVMTLALSPSFAFWAGGGLETALFAALLLATWLCIECATPGRRIPALLTGGLAGVLAVTRPEGHLLVLLVGPLLWTRGLPWRQVAAAVGIAAAIALVAAAARGAYFGALLPNPVLAKTALARASLIRGVAYVGEGLRDEALYCLVPAILWGDHRSRRHRSLLLWFGAGCALAVVAGGDGLYRSRLLAPYLPLLVLAASSGLERLWAGGPVWRTVALAGPVSAVLIPLANPHFFRSHTLADVREWEQHWSAVGTALAPHRVPSALLATNVAGRLPYSSGWRTLDLLGLVDRTIATTPITDAGRGYAGHERAAPAYVLERKPDVLYLSVLDGLPTEMLAAPGVAETVVGRGSLYRYAPLFAAPEFWRRYAPARLPLDDGTGASLFVRRDGVLGALATPRRSDPHREPDLGRSASPVAPDR
ncbi:MAG: hypothetical protein JW751_09615 [Polyangiaceae bacterium]|nr:hypothetical protein [Polyangiaceae bacterium]